MDPVALNQLGLLLFLPLRFSGALAEVPAPSAVFEGSLADVSLLAGLLVGLAEASRWLDRSWGTQLGFTSRRGEIHLALLRDTNAVRAFHTSNLSTEQLYTCAL